MFSQDQNKEDLFVYQSLNSNSEIFKLALLVDTYENFINFCHFFNIHLSRL
jgi:hypothetical protein